MAVIAPFKGITYNPEKFSDISSLVSPPYDVISQKDQDKYYLKNDYNIVRIILGKDMPNDNENSNKYTRASQYLKSWIEEKIFIEDKEPCMYVHSQQFEYKGKKYNRKGFFGIVRLDNSKTVKFHEQTYLKPKEDRMKLLKATQANTEPVFMIYKGFPVKIPETEPLFSFIDENGHHHALWRVTDLNSIEDFCSDFAEKSLYIADGHHRFETAFKYARDINIDPNSSDTRNFVLSFFVEESDPGLLILPTHRLLNISFEDIELIKSNAKRYFLIVEIDSFEKIEKSKGKVFGFFNRKDNKLFMFKLRDVIAKNKVMKSKGVENQSEIDTAILHNLLIDDVLEKYKTDGTKQVIGYSHDDKEVISLVRSGEYTCAFLLKPTTVSEIMKVADAEIKMPQKSTFFYPKILSGLVLRRF